AARDAAIGVEQAGQAATGTGRALNKLASEYSGLAGVQAQATKESSKADKAAADYLGRLQMQYDALGKNRAELEAMRAKQAGLSVEMQKAAAAIGAKIDAWHRDEEAAKAAARAEEQAARAAAKHGGEASDAMKRLGLETAGAKRELLVLAREAMTGNFSRMPGTMMVLAKQTNLATLAVGLLTHPLVIAASTVALLGKAFYDGTQEVRGFNLAIETTGNFAGATASRVEQIAARANQVSGINTGAAREAATSMVQAGRLGIDTIGNLTRSVETYAAVTGQKTAAAAADLVKMFERPSEGAYKLNQHFHFLTLAQFQYIETLVKQGRQEEAQLELSRRLADHLQTQMISSLTGVEKWWKRVGSAASDAWAQMQKALPGTRTNGDMLAFKQAELRDLDSLTGPAGKSDAVAQRRKRLQAEIAALEAAMQVEADAAEREAENKRNTQRQIDADRSFNARAESLKNWREKLAEETRKIREEGQLLGKTQGEIDDQIARATEKLTPKTPKPKADPAESAFSQQRLALAKAIAAEQQKIANVDAGMAEGENSRTTALEEWLKFSKEGANLLPAQVEQLQAMAQQADALNKTLAERREQKQIDARLPKELADLDAQLLAATGRSADAAAAKITERFRQLRADLAKSTNPNIDKDAELAKLARLESIEKAKAELADLQQQVDRIFGNQGRAEQSIQLNVQTGLISEIDARKQVVALHQQTANEVDALIPRMTTLAQLVGDPKLADGVLNLLQQTRALRVATNELGDVFGKTFQSGFASALEGLATRTKSLGDAVRGMLSDLTAGMARWAAEQLASEAKTGLLQMLGLGGDAASGAAQAAAMSAASAAAATEMGVGIT
ncbi:MAG: phage tail length tape measure family protein, partial [Burkholderiaceae bacterium]